MKLVMVGLTSALTCKLLLGCSNDNEVDRTFDCREICDQYSDCVTDIDVTECTDHCEDEADAHSNVEQAVDTCEDCVDGRSCDEMASCIPACELVPVPPR
jgi:hypothetical protein